MKTLNPIHDYYESIAGSYDSTRFGNSYGDFINSQELAFLYRRLEMPKTNILNMGCGTGRFMEFATDGLDFSEKMLQVAAQKYPNRKFHHADARTTNFVDNSFDAVICLHVLMHQDKASSAQILGECHRILKPDGLLLVDFPSARRRRLLRHQPEGWHGASAFTLAEFQGLHSQEFRLEAAVGVLFFPIHRLPILLRKLVYPIDKALCRSPLLELSSYLLLALRRG